MQSVFVKIPVLGDKIIRELDNSSLVKCKEVKRSWYNFIKAEKILWFRKIQNCIGDENKFSKARKKLLTKVSSDLVMQVAIGCQQACATFQIFNIQISPIHMAAAAGNLDLYQLMMLKLAGMNQTDIFGKVPPIFPAALNYDMCKFIIENVDDKNPAMHNGSTPLHTAAKNGHYEICQLLISNVNEKNPAKHDETTPLYLAAQNGHFEICLLIISTMGEKNPAMPSGLTPLHIAATEGYYKIWGRRKLFSFSFLFFYLKILFFLLGNSFFFIR